MSVHPAFKPESLTLSAPHGAQQLPIEHHPQLYIVGGDVILSARTGIPPTGLCEPQNSPEPPKIVLFRVHKGILSHNSAVFNNIFLDATAPAGDTYDEALVVPMIGDRAEDLAQLLISAGFRRLDPDKPRRLSGVIRLMDKYLFEEQRKYLIEQVTSDWPTSLLDWDRRETELHALEQYPTLEILDCRRVFPHKPDPAVAIAFAREFGCTEILPAAFYQLSITPSWNLFEPGGPQTAEWGLLSREDLLRYMHGCQRLWGNKIRPEELLGDACRTNYEDHMQSLLPGTGLTIADDPECLPPAEELLQLLLSTSYRDQIPVDRLKILKDMLDRWYRFQSDFEDKLCEDCSDSLSDTLSRMREDVWTKLTQTFALGS